jgi:4-hydroxybutyrate CoA-transferase
MKIINAREAISIIPKNAVIGLGHACGEPQTLIEALIESRSRFHNAQLIGMVQFCTRRIWDADHGERFKWKSFMMDPPLIEAASGGLADYIPCRYYEMSSLFVNKNLNLDVALISVSAPGKDGAMSLGVAVDHTLAMARSAKMVIAEINRQMPRVNGETFLNSSQIHYGVESDRPLHQVNGKAPNETERKISEHIASLIPDGATIQFGIGKIPHALMPALRGKKHLGVHSGLLIDGVVDLMEAGVVDNSQKTLHCGKTITTTMIGTDRLFRFVSNNPAVESYPSSYTHNPAVLAQIDHLYSINEALQVDFSGQVNAETIDGIQIGGIGGQADFVPWAHLSGGGSSIIALPSTTQNGKTSRIVVQFERGSAVSSMRYDVDYVVTEYGVASLRGKSLKERARVLLEISHPAFREELEAEHLNFLSKASPGIKYHMCSEKESS